jgi:hypothetical protein
VALVAFGLALPACKSEKSYPESTEGLKQLNVDLMAASDSDAVKLGEALALPEPDKWFTQRFGTELGQKLASEYAENRGELSKLKEFWAKAKAKNRTEIIVEEHKSADDEGLNALQEAALRAMKPPMTLYTVKMVEPGQALGTSLRSFVYIDGKFRYLGKMKAAKPGANPLDELSKRDLKAALRGRGGN